MEKIVKKTLTENIKIYHADCMDVMSDYPDNYFSLAIVDPPYGINKGSGKIGGGIKLHGFKKPLPTDFKPVAGGDKDTPSQEYFDELKRVSKNQIIWGGNYFIDKIKNPSPCWLVWDKKNGKTDFADCELAYTSLKTAVRKFSFLWCGCIQDDMKTRAKRIHPNQKPTQLYQWILEKYASPKDIILDTHLGSGNSAIAAHYFGCKFVGVELSEYYYQVAIDNFKRNTKQIRLL